MKFKSAYILTLFIITIFSCGKRVDKSDNRTVFRYNESIGISSLDPAFAKDQAKIWPCNQLYNGLVQLNEKLEVLPCIAKSWTISDDGTIYTFTLRNDVNFHDHKLFKDGKGRKVIASDFEYSLKRIIDTKIVSPGAWIFNNVNNENGKYSFTAINDTTFQIVLSGAFPPFLGLLSMQYCSVVPYEVVNYYVQDFRKNPVGTGPFQFKMWKEGVKLVLLKNNNYFEKDEKGNKLPYLDAVAITFIIDKQTAFLEFIKGNIDFLSGIEASYKDELLTRHGKLNPKYEGKIKMVSQSYLNTEYLGILVDKKSEIAQNSPLKSKKVRQAINYGFDRKKMMRYLRNNIGTPAYCGIIPKGMPSFDSSIVKGYSYDQARAKRLLLEAGYPGGKGLGDITLSTNSSYLDLCKYIQHQLEEIGLSVKIEVNPPSTLREMISKSELQFFRASWIGDYPDAENYLSLFYSKNFSPAGPNYTHFSNKKFDALFEKAQNEVNDSLRFSYYQQMDKIINWI